MNIKTLIYITLRRFLELLVPTAFFSALATLLAELNLLPFSMAITIVLCFMAGGFFYIQVIMMRNCYFDLKDDVIHYTANAIAYILFAAVSVLLFFLDNRIYTWIFSIMKFLHFSPFGLPSAVSLGIFHLGGIAAVILAPAGLSQVLVYMEEDAKFYEGDDEDN